MPFEILVVDCQYDFIDGSLACHHSNEAIKNIIDFINANHDDKVYYSADNHSLNHCSYVQNGGTWPVHCNSGTHGADIHEDFYTKIKNPAQRPNDLNIYYKGDNDSVEEYSAYDARDKAGTKLSDVIGSYVAVVGIASEFCVRETVIALKNSGRSVDVIEDCLAWVDDEGHKKNIRELSDMGVYVLEDD